MFIGVVTELQEKLLASQHHDLKPSEEFLESFSGIIGSKWPSLAAFLSLDAAEIEDLKKEESVSQSQALRMLKKWCLKKDACYGQLCRTLKTISMLQ